MADHQLAIDVNNLTRNFKDKLAVDKVSFKIPQGEIYAFLGPNGAGKSTTVKMLITLLEPDSGDIKILGFDAKTQSEEIRLKIGVALQEASLDESQTGIEFLQLQGRLYGLTTAEIKQRIVDLTPLIDIGEALKKPIKTYSGGMKRRLDLAAAIMHNPKILFLDEPTTGLDPVSRKKVWEQIKSLNDDFGVTIFLTTQYLDEADQLADRVGIIKDGKLVVQDTPQNLKDSIGGDLIIVKSPYFNKVDSKELETIPGISKVDLNHKDKEIIFTTQSGSKSVGAVVLELNKRNIEIESLSASYNHP
jgi:ABC-2 type transport system ATP-binding protein